MNDRVGPWVRRFLVEYLIGERNYSLHTQQSRRDTFVLFLPFAAKRCRCALDQLALIRINPKLVREFLRHLEQVRHCSPSTINQRLISLRAWARFVGINSPEHLEWSGQMRSVHLKKHAPAPMNYLEKKEMKALLASPDQRDRQGFRDYVLLLFLYNTGARVSELVALNRQDFPGGTGQTVVLHGKGRKYGKVVVMQRCSSRALRLQGPSAYELSITTGRQGTEDHRRSAEIDSSRPEVSGLSPKPASSSPSWLQRRDAWFGGSRGRDKEQSLLWGH